ncbi:helix-turn-helix domain-containing protein [Aureibacter tunicatorum]|uniref:YesN/AraC family two-component response regulator n=1 Tax=Aureibacter tunicatorum TaxID=866807 RepID=A0AAE3XPS0_9BACT|nr:helix-turn-helix domain-containing protein [Aureibacter tunicatorum]MDR6241806.1 YesN/AraC family two-component response regulator [Aureibacter tunicatorum]BDD07053.1 transcriptional regulator [Aureibacter tunicatorum]
MENHKDIASLLQAMNISHLLQCDEFHILKFRDHVNTIPHQTFIRKCDFFQIYFSKQYNLDILIDDSNYSIKDKTILSFLTPQQTLSVDVKNIEGISNGYMIVFQSSFLNNGFSDFDVQQKFPYFNLNYSPVYFLENNSSIFEELFEKIHALFNNLNHENLEIIRAYLSILLYESRKSFLVGSIKKNFKTRAQEISFSFECLVRKNSHSRNSLNYYADKLNISTVYLSECVKKATNRTAKQIINEYIILEASTLLMQSSDTIEEISDKLGFSATSNFINFFKKHSNHSPSKFRKSTKPSF